jgi:hypothetical protein
VSLSCVSLSDLENIFTNLHGVISHYRYSPGRMFASSISDGVPGNFYWLKHFFRTINLGSIKLVTEMKSRNISWG